MGLQRLGRNGKLSNNNNVSQRKTTRTSKSKGASPVAQTVKNPPAVQVWLN